MRATVRVYWRLLVAGFRRQSAYRLAALGGLVANVSFGLLKRLAFDAEQTTAAKVLAAVSERAEVLDLSVEEPDIEDVVRRIYAADR
jgi:ABC-2 type transport system ATP-binding protein